MASQLEILSYLQSNFNVVSIEGELITINKSWDDGRSQLVFVNVGASMLMISSPIAAISDINVDVALQFLSDMNNPFGVRKVGEFLAVSNIGFTETTDAVELDFPINLIAEGADEIEKALHGKDIL